MQGGPAVRTVLHSRSFLVSIHVVVSYIACLTFHTSHIASVFKSIDQPQEISHEIDSFMFTIGGPYSHMAGLAAGYDVPATGYDDKTQGIELP